MHVALMPVVEAEARGVHYFEFDRHYAKFSHFVQVLVDAPRTPFLHGITTPTRAHDPGRNALVHLVLFRPTACSGPACCRSPAAHAGRYLTLAPVARLSPLVLHSMNRSRAGAAKAIGLSKRSIYEAETFVQPWRAYEARQQVLAQRADAKLARAQRVAVLQDTTCQRQWWLPEAEQNTMVQSWLLPWLRGSGRRCYEGPWLGAGFNQARRIRCMRDEIQRRHEPGRLGYLHPLPETVAHAILLFVGHVVDADADGAPQVLLICNSTAPGRPAHCPLARARAAASNMGVDCTVTSVTSLGVHDDQLSPEEYCAYVTVETSANLDLMAEARRRPRPSQLHTDAVPDDERDLLGHRAERANVEDEGGAGGAEHYPEEPDRDRPALTEGVRYQPDKHARLHPTDVLKVVHRLDVASRLDKRAGDRHKRLASFMELHHRDYELVKRARRVSPPPPEPTGAASYSM